MKRIYMDIFRIVQVSDTEFWVEQKASEIKRYGLFNLRRKEVVEWQRTPLDSIEKAGFYLFPRYKTFSTIDEANKWIADKQKYPIYHSVEPDQPGRDYENLETK